MAFAGTLAAFLLACAGLAGAAPPTTAGFLVAERGTVAAAPLGAESVSIDTSGPAANRMIPCHAVVHIGDSTSVGLVSYDYLPDRKQRIGHRYAEIGAKEQHLEISGATSIVETLEGGINAEEVARQLVSDGYRGCWVLALGTNDTADVFVGSSVGLTARIQRMMSVIGNQPVMWVTVKTLVPNGPYAESNMELWNDALLQECPKYPNMRVFDWASVVRDDWFIDDGIHYTSPGYAARARLLAAELDKAFPAGGASPGCVVR